MRELGVVPADRARPVLRGVALEVARGEAVGISGPSGSGKSTLIAAVAGLVPWHRPARVTGSVAVDGEPLDGLDPAQRARLVATVPDRPESQLFLPTPRAELEAAARLHGGRADPRRLAAALGIGPLLDRATATLSSGERQRVALAAGLAAAPEAPVLLDEPTAHLDRDGAAALGALLREVTRAGGGVLIAEQAGWRLGGSVARWTRLDGGVLTAGPSPAPPPLPRPPSVPGGGPVLEACGLTIERGGRVLLGDVSLAIRPGEVVALEGPNGSGKTALARVLAGVARPASGRVVRRGRTVLMVPSSPLQLLETTVAAEAASTGAEAEAIARVLRRHGLDALAARAPWTLSTGEARRLVHAVLDLLRPDVMILDEPAGGLDPSNLEMLAGLIHRRAAGGRAYLVITHREALARAAHRRLAIRGGRLVEAP